MSNGQWIEGATLDLWEDRHREQIARIEDLEKDKRLILDERDRTFALMLDRAKAAEAKVEVAADTIEKALQAKGIKDEWAWALEDTFDLLKGDTP